MAPPGIEPGSCPRQGHILAVGLWGRELFLIGKKCLKSLFLNLVYGKERAVQKKQHRGDLVFCAFNCGVVFC